MRDVSREGEKEPSPRLNMTVTEMSTGFLWLRRSEILLSMAWAVRLGILSGVSGLSSLLTKISQLHAVPYYGVQNVK
jgi:hypothetical protein